MKILLVNDDGFDAVGIKELRKVVENYGEVYTVAPHTGVSGAGCGLTTFKPYKVHKVDDKNFRVEGTPVDCVIFAVSHFGKIFDVVISGSNHGFNLSHDIMYSGTCGAVYQALMQGIPAIAFSEDRKDTAWEVKKWGKEVMDYILSNNLLSKDYFINVNFPKQEFTESKGIVLTNLFLRTTKYEITSIDGEDYMIKHTHDDENAPEGSDVYAIRHGYISITPMGVTTYKDKDLVDLKSKM